VDLRAAQLAAQIKRVLEPEYKPRNPILDAIGLITLEASKDPTQRTLATLTREIQNLRGDLAALTSGGGVVLNTMAENKYIDILNKYTDLLNKPVTFVSSSGRLRDFPQTFYGLQLSTKTAVYPPEPDRDSEQKEDERSIP
jgi:hypothetical protein